MPTQFIGIKEFRNNLATLTQQAQRTGVHYIVLNKNKPVLEVKPLSTKDATLEKLIPKDQAWFWTPEWQAKEREADEDIRMGRVSGPFTSADELIKHLHGVGKNSRKK